MNLLEILRYLRFVVQERALALLARSTGNGSTEGRGLTLTDELRNRVATTCLAAYQHPLSIQGDAAREYAPYVAAAASLGYLTTATEGGFGRKWRITEKGLRFTDLWLSEEEGQ
jgi:hypothetical protein